MTEFESICRHIAKKRGRDPDENRGGDGFTDSPLWAGYQPIAQEFLSVAKDLGWLPPDRAKAMRNGIYTASKTIHAGRWLALRESGVPVISTWIDEAGAGQTDDFSDLWSRCVGEARSAKVLIAYREPDEILKGAFIEIGAALAVGTPVFCVGDFSGMSFLHHPLVHSFDNLDDAVAAAIRAMKETT